MSDKKIFNTDYLHGKVDYILNLSLDRLKGGLSRKKTELIKSKLIQIGKEELHMDCRFNQLVSQIEEGGIERWYYNDGTPEGKLLITFHPVEINFVGGEDGNSIRATFKYE